MALTVWDRCKVAQTRLGHSIGGGFSKLVVPKEAKLLYLAEFDPYFTYKCESAVEGSERSRDGTEELDIPDKLPTVLYVRRRDIFFYFVAILTYIFDILSDCFIAYYHYINDRVFAALIVSLFIVVPSLLLNLMSYLFWRYDENRRIERQQIVDKKASRRKTLWMLASIFQLGPVRWYAEAIYSGIQFRRTPPLDEAAEELRLRWFCRMISADRDASLLRFFEAFLESVPQLVVQGFLAANYFWRYHTERSGHPLPLFLYAQLASTALSVLSVSYSISVQHRTLRITRPDKANMELWETAMQIMWRYFTILPRFICIVFFILCYGYWTVLFVLIHMLISLLHIMRLQTIEHKFISPATECGLVFINSLIHTFAPFNMTEGHTKWRYVIAYSIEAIENGIILTASIFNDSFNFPYKCQISIFCAMSFVLGITFMAAYYGCCHPSRRVPSIAVGRANDQEDSALPLEPLSANIRVVVPEGFADPTKSNEQ
ncbi:hypothetical protein QR680_001994 [Steinernema hermaphroditum]|uniref:XK-related protein n=1 Tax=Steinernema hermaphroditum TaxID=289476 RepID=A0AA39H1L4_9BILA|nr:hypothetical protein QR680_001994 [Steinernema hermaphroditum]